MPEAKLSVLRTERTEICEDVVRILELALEDARNGLVTAAAIAVVRPNGEINHLISQSDQPAQILGAVSFMLYRLQKNADDDV